MAQSTVSQRLRQLEDELGAALIVRGGRTLTLTAATVMIEALTAAHLDPTIVVAPDLGALKRAERFGAALGLPVAVVQKSRQSSTVVQALDLVGDVAGRRALIVDDMIATGATIAAAARLLTSRGGEPVAVLATHGLFVGETAAWLGSLGGATSMVTDTVPAGRAAPEGLEVVGVGPLLAEAIGRLHAERSIEDLLG
jgi:ribose-phosphate pyrophosphokinase